MQTDQYNKLIGGIVGVLTGYAVSRNILPPDFQTPDMQLAIQTAVMGFFIWAFPPNKS